MNYYYIQQRVLDDNPISGIYKITNKINNRVYIGKSSDIECRWQEHQSALNKQIHHNEELQKDWNYYGEDNFKFEIIEKCPHWEYNYKEIYYFFQFNNLYNTIKRVEIICYNICELLKSLVSLEDTLKFEYQHITTYKSKKLSWNLWIKYNDKIIILFLYHSSKEFTQDRKNYIKSKNNINFIPIHIGKEKPIDYLCDIKIKIPLLKIIKSQ